MVTSYESYVLCQMMKKDFIKHGFGIGAVIFALAAVIALPLRTVQFFTVLEDGTGFYSEMNFGVYLLFGILAASILALLFIGISCKVPYLEYIISAFFKVVNKKIDEFSLFL